MSVTTHRIIAGSSASLAPLPDGSVDLVVTSPPYPMIGMWDAQFAAGDPEVGLALAAGDGGAAFEAMHRLLDPVWSECRRVVGDGGFVLVNIGDATRTVGDDFRLYSSHTRITEKFLSLGFQALPLIIWRKTTNAPNKFMGSGMLPAGAYVTLEHEYILIFRKGGKRRFDSEADKRRRGESAFFWEERNRWFSDLWDLAGRRQTMGAGGARGRNAAFPFELAFRLINMYSLRGDLVLDPFLGTGTTSIAALAACRDSIGYETEPELCREAGKALLVCRSRVNAEITARLRRHYAFISEAETGGRTFKFINTPHGFKVVGAQERNILLETVSDIRQTGPLAFEAAYERLEDHPEKIRS